MANAHRYDSTTTLADHTRSVMDRRAVVDQAKGIIMAERRCTAEEAFAILAKVCEYSGREPAEVAAALVGSATRPRRSSVRPAREVPAPHR
jgi:AmiR/NasT family two-component response regulator